MECLSDEKWVDFLTDELRNEMSTKEIKTIELHISQCVKCQTEKEKFLKVFCRLGSVEFKNRMRRERHTN